MKQQKHKYGYFDDDRKEYVITNPHTPVKWINYIGTLAFGGFIDHTGGSLICKGDPAENRITKYIPHLPASDFRGETLYLRINENNTYKVFSPFYVPTLDSCDLYECHVGLGYNRIITQVQGIRTQVTIFVPLDGSQVIRDIQITNQRDTPCHIEAIPVVEYTHPQAIKQFNNGDWVPQTMQSQVHQLDDGLTVVAQYPFMHRDTKVNYFTSNRPVSSFDTDRKVFLGDNEYRGWANPKSLHQKELNNSVALRGDNIAALMHHLGTIPPGQSQRIITQLGQDASIQAALPGIRKYLDEQAVDQSLQEMVDFWDDYLSKMQVTTPDPSMNSMLSIHNPRQCHTTKNWSRYLSLYQMGLGARGIGFRDSSQDVLGIMDRMPQQAKDLITTLLKVQKANGSAMHQLNPLTMIATEGESLEKEGYPHYYGDDHLWVVLSICAYLKETGDLAFLQQDIPYYEKDRQGNPLETGSVLDHIRRALAFTKTDRGKHDLPLLGFADWNDCVNLQTGAESFFIASLYGKALLEVIQLLDYMGDEQAVSQYRTDYAQIKQTFNTCAWDGQWFKRYFDPQGQPLGSHENEKSQIYTNGQSWPVIAGFADDEKATLALESVYTKLNTKHGIKLSTPGYDAFDDDIGGVTTYPPGAKENGGIFLHANPWAMIAETILGNGDRAFQYYTQINPATKNDIIDLFECEPYAYPQNILGDEHPQFGLGRNSWLSGTSAWTYVAGTQHILGIQPTYTGLRIDPCIPRSWDGFQATRKFRGDLYKIVVKNPDHVSKGVQSLSVDGVEIPDHIVPIAGDGQTHTVEVVMG